VGWKEDRKEEGGRVLARRASGLREDDSGIEVRERGEPSGGWGERKFTEAICC